MAKVYVDAGHGGKDVGAIGIGNVHEADINLNVCKHLQTELQRQGIEVKMCRTTDVFKDLKARTSEANKWGADIVCSVHCNAFKDVTANGTEVFCYKMGGNGEKIATYVQNELLSVLGTKSRGVKEGNLAMVRDTNAPAILCELGFITNASDCSKIRANEKNCAIAICKGICKYLGITYKGETKVTNDYSKHWAKKAIEYCIEKKYMVGDGKGKFRPNDKLTRGEMAQILYNLDHNK